MPRKKKRSKAPDNSGSIFWRKDRRCWCVKVTLPDGRSVRRNAKTEDEAVAIRNELLGKVASGVPVGSTATVAQQLQSWREHVLPAKQLAPATTSQYEWCIGVLTKDLGRVKLRNLTPEQVERFLGQCAKEGYSRNSVRLFRTTLGLVLGEAERRGHVARNVARLAHLPADAAPVAQRRALSDAECARLLAAAKHDRLNAFWVLALTTGARQGELLALSWDDVDLTEGTLAINKGVRRASAVGSQWAIGPTKTPGSVRTLRLSPTALRALKAHQTAQKRERLASKPRWPDTDLVFTSTTGTLIDRNNLRRQWDALTKAADLEGVVLHELRHTAASHAVDAGVALTTVADQLGHSNVETLARTYRQRTRPVVDGVAEVMERVVTPVRKRRV
jgi:integrase